VITAFAIPNPGCSSQGSRFFRVWWFSELPHRTNHPAYFGLVNVTWTSPFSRRQFHKLVRTDLADCDADHQFRQALWKTSAPPALGLACLSPQCHTSPAILLIKEMKFMPAEVLEKPGATEEARRQIPKIRSIVSDVMDDSVRSASRVIRHGRYAAEDLLDQAEHKVKQRPFQAIGTVFAAGVLLGGLVTWIGFRRR
jgi:ElaB/YqjD/DUF883 family membrane-anchored ribosome-binding protein